MDAPTPDKTKPAGPIAEHLRLITISGVPIGVNWTVLIIAWLIGSGLANTTFPEAYPGYRPVEYGLAGLLAVILYLSSLLAHELAHARMARRHGVEVEGITLWLFGGVAKLKGEMPTARAELQTAAVGPAASLALGAMWFGLSLAGIPVGAPDLVLGVLSWLAVINVVLAVFNMLPAFPLDGGRVFRAAIWSRTNDQISATMTAAAVSRAFAVAFVIFGTAVIASGAIINGAWFMFIGWFLWSAAGAETSATTSAGAFGGRTVAEYMTPNPTVIPGELPVSTAISDVVLRNRWSAYPVIDDRGVLVGLLTLDSIRSVRPERRHSTTVAQACFPRNHIAVAAPEEPLPDALERMAHFIPRRIVVVDGRDRPIGIVSVTDVTRTLEFARLGEPALKAGTATATIA